METVETKLLLSQVGFLLWWLIQFDLKKSNHVYKRISILANYKIQYFSIFYCCEKESDMKWSREC